MRCRIVLLCFLLLIGKADALKINLPPVAWPGRVIAVTITSVEGVSRVSGEFLKQRFECYPFASGFKGIIGVPLEQLPGTREVNLTIIGNDGSQQKLTRNVLIKGVKYPVTAFKLRPAKKKLLVQDLIQQEWARIEKVLLVEAPAQEWQGKFILPAAGPVSMRFGAQEYVNGQKRGQHRGLDLAVGMSSTVEAANKGKVVFADKLKAFGGTIVVDHGQGIHTLYFHLSKLLVKVGDEVEKGAKIAFSGNSGISSGPHLHWGMSVHNLRVDPHQWVKNEI